jgi:hypothetical protein
VQIIICSSFSDVRVVRLTLEGTHAGKKRSETDPCKYHVPSSPCLIWDSHRTDRPLRHSGLVSRERTAWQWPFSSKCDKLLVLSFLSKKSCLTLGPFIGVVTTEGTFYHVPGRFGSPPLPGSRPHIYTVFATRLPTLSRLEQDCSRKYRQLEAQDASRRSPREVHRIQQIP